jgi:hypothetical protein
MNGYALLWVLVLLMTGVICTRCLTVRSREILLPAVSQPGFLTRVRSSKKRECFRQRVGVSEGDGVTK